MRVQSLNLLLLLTLLERSTLYSSAEHRVKLSSLSLSNLIWAMTFNKSIYSFIATSYSDNYFIVFCFDKNPLLSICIYSFLFSDEEQASFIVHLIVVDIISQFLIGWIVFDWLIYKVHPLQIIHVLMNSLKLMLTFPNLVKQFLMLFYYTLQLELAFFITAFHNVELIHEVLVFEILLTHLVL